MVIHVEVMLSLKNSEIVSHSSQIHWIRQIFQFFVSKPSGIRNVIPASLTKTKSEMLPHKHGYVAIRL